jgi:hypothetical protein
MVIPPDKFDTPALRLLHSRLAVQRKVAAMVKGAGLRVRECKYELVITNPMEPERGRIRVEYGDGFASLEKTSRDCLGHLEGFEDEDDGPGVGADQILRALGARTLDAAGPQQASGFAGSADQAEE